MNTQLIADCLKRIETDLATVKGEIFGLPPGNRVEQYIDANLHRRADCSLPFTDFYSGFKAWLSEWERDNWPKAKVQQELSGLALAIGYEGRTDQPRKMVVGLALTPPPAPEPESEPEQKQPYDAEPMGEIVRSMVDVWGTKNGIYGRMYTWADIATKLNEQGILDPDGDQWNERTAHSFYYS